MFSLLAFLASAVAGQGVGPGRNVGLTVADTAFLDDVQRRSALYFVEQSDPITGLVLDRAPASGAPGRGPSSVAATGFGLTALCIADSRGWLPPGDALRRVRATLRFIVAQHAHERGWMYHFVSAATGERMWRSEASTIDTALLLQGALFAREYLRDREVALMVDWIFGRIDWRWAQNGGKTLSHGWKPETGFIPYRWDGYAEMLGLYLLGIGAPSRALPVDAWHAWRREPRIKRDGRDFIQCGPLFTHQFSHAWFDFRDRRDAYADYWQNSVDATLVQREWSAAQSHRFQYWSRDLWGLTASDSEHGYLAWGTPVSAQPGDDLSDGTLVPCAPGGSLPFAPEECITALRRMKEVGGDRLWGRYGFADAFNPQTGWVATDVIGIDVGITLIMAENLRTGLVWKMFMKAPEVQRGMRFAGFSRMGAESPGFVATRFP